MGLAGALSLSVITAASAQQGSGGFGRRGRGAPVLSPAWIDHLSLSADPSGNLKFNKSSLSAKAGTVTMTMDNPSSVPHGIAVQGNGVNKVGSTVTKGGKSTITVTLKPGKYTFYCPVDAHRAAGMQGTLTVQ